MRILIVDSDKEICLYLQSQFERKNFAVDTAHNGTQGSYLATIYDYDLIVLECALPGKNGFLICSEIRSLTHTTRQHTPIIFLSTNEEVAHKIHSFAIGADDYVTKPFFFEELYARVQAILRRPPIREPTIVMVDDLAINISQQYASRNGIRIYFTRKEFAIIEYLAHHVNQIIPRSSLCEHIWDMNADPFSNTIETHILNIRKKIEMHGKSRLIHTISGIGYKLSERK